MLIRWIIVLFGVSLGSTSTKAGVITATSKNDTADPTLLNFKSSRNFKPKRELDDFDFDVSTFDASASVFPDKEINGLPSFANEDADISALIPTSFKVTRSNSENLGTHGQNFEPSSFPATNYGPNSAQQSSEVQASPSSNEDQDALGQARQSNTAYNNQVTTPYYEGYVNQPKYSVAKPSAFSSENAYKTPQKLSYNGYPPLTDMSSNVPIYGPLTQLPPQPLASSHQQIQQPNPQNNLYKAQFAQGIKNFQPAKVYAPSHRHDQQQQPFDSPFQNFGQSPYDYPQYTTNPTVEINGKKLTLPVLQLQTAPNFPGYIQALDTTPVIFSAESGIQYKTEPNFGISLNYAEPKKFNPNQRSGTNTPFLNSHNPGPIQVLPVQTASSTAQFPKYKGASVAQFPAKGFSKIPNDYQEFKSQPQLHFDGNGSRKQKSYHKPAFYTKPLEEIRKDVEVINKKKPIPPLPKHDDDDDEDERAENDSGEDYKGGDPYFRKNEHDVEPLPRKYFKDSELEGDFKPSKNYPFKEYDDKFIKQKKSPSKDNYEDDEDEDTNIDLAAKYRYLSKSDNEEDDDDDENESAEDKPQSKYKNHPVREEFRNNSEEDDRDEEETQKHEKKEKSVAYDRDSQHSSKKPRTPRREHRKNYDDEFDESFKKKASKPKSPHHRSKGFSDFEDRPHSYSNFHKDESPSKSSKKGRHRTYRDETGEPSHRPFSSSGSPKYSSKFFPKTEESNTRRSYLNSKESSTKIPHVIWEESYGLKKLSNPEDESRPSSYSREEASASARKPLPAPVHEFTSTKPSSGHKASSAINAKEGIDSYDIGSSTYSPHSSWKTSSTKKKPIHGDSYSRPSTASGPRSLAHTKQAFFNPSLGRGELFHSLKGI